MTAIGTSASITTSDRREMSAVHLIVCHCFDFTHALYRSEFMYRNSVIA